VLIFASLYMKFELLGRDHSVAERQRRAAASQTRKEDG
jgi:hypothetical protein